ncbi:unnamed protein product [Protopolystoma xenopodis]|uniref:Uncharacterized protein n=1 Tax=Protopolystoma xenopodis TaxID=117903 RepID=A0A3S5AIF0_9PLAT|nr:unnamed protein product [Protopolystoma xenopodis]
MRTTGFNQPAGPSVASASSYASSNTTAAFGIGKRYLLVGGSSLIPSPTTAAFGSLEGSESIELSMTGTKPPVFGIDTSGPHLVASQLPQIVSTKHSGDMDLDSGFSNIVLPGGLISCSASNSESFLDGHHLASSITSPNKVHISLTAATGIPTTLRNTSSPSSPGQVQLHCDQTDLLVYSSSTHAVRSAPTDRDPLGDEEATRAGCVLLQAAAVAVGASQTSEPDPEASNSTTEPITKGTQATPVAS